MKTHQIPFHENIFSNSLKTESSLFFLQNIFCISRKPIKKGKRICCAQFTSKLKTNFWLNQFLVSFEAFFFFFQFQFHNSFFSSFSISIKKAGKINFRLSARSNLQAKQFQFNIAMNIKNREAFSHLFLIFFLSLQSSIVCFDFIFIDAELNLFIFFAIAHRCLCVEFFFLWHQLV